MNGYFQGDQVPDTASADPNIISPEQFKYKSKNEILSPILVKKWTI